MIDVIQGCIKSCSTQEVTPVKPGWVGHTRNAVFSSVPWVLRDSRLEAVWQRVNDMENMSPEEQEVYLEMQHSCRETREMTLKSVKLALMWCQKSEL